MRKVPEKPPLDASGRPAAAPAIASRHWSFTHLCGWISDGFGEYGMMVYAYDACIEDAIAVPDTPAPAQTPD
ncbi:hypothetical protein WBP07_32215 [Novosphingobium sp. BL-8A]|uniref:hypothetical protein n=1 Tax=Novosphingobium sp. BL-8A TaxID=3127639 RepID=UPI0037568D76